MSYRDFKLFRVLKNRSAFRRWKARDYAAPAPQEVKEAVMRRNSIAGATWVETGTFKGDTTRFLSGFAPKVVTLEPAAALYQAACRRFAGRSDIEIINDTSENAFPTLLPRLSGDVCFWLDGHFSAGSTFQGDHDTPILQELDAIEAALPKLGRVVVLIDDVRCFDPREPDWATYPERAVLVDWAQRLGLAWHIEHDMFVATGAARG